MARIAEGDLRRPTLEVLARAKGGWVSTTDLINILDAEFDPRGLDARTLGGRYDSYFSQKVRNMISHRKGSTSFVARGFVEYVKVDGVGGLRITRLGRALLRKPVEVQEEMLDARAS